MVNTSIVHSLIAMRLVSISMRALTHINTSELLKKTNRMRNDQLNSMLVYFKCSYVVKSVYNQKVKKGNENVPLRNVSLNALTRMGLYASLHQGKRSSINIIFWMVKTLMQRLKTNFVEDSGYLTNNSMSCYITYRRIRKFS